MTSTPMRTLEPRTLGATGLTVSSIAVGTSPLGSMPRLYGYEVDADDAVATVRAMLNSPLTFIDTSNGYGNGASERRIGAAIRAAGGLPAGVVLATKIDPDPDTGDFSGRRARASVAESLERLGLDHLDLLHLHDPEVIGFDRSMADDGPVAAMLAMQREGVVDHLGVAGGPVELMRRFVATGHFSVVLTHNRWSLLDRSADALIDDAVAAGVGVINAAPFSGGILVKGPEQHPRYGYGDANDRVLEHVRNIRGACREAGVSMAAAALQFSTRDPRIASTVVGISSQERIDQTLELQAVHIPESLWDRLADLALPDDLWLW